MMKKNIQQLEEDIANIIKGIAYFDIIVIHSDFIINYISIENQKLKIAENPNFDAYAAWSMIDLKNQGFIDITYLNKFLSQVKQIYLMNLKQKKQIQNKQSQQNSSQHKRMSIFSKSNNSTQ